MLVNLVNKQRRAVSLIKTVLLGKGITGRSICVEAYNWSYSYGGNGDNFAVFVSAPTGTDIEPYYETGRTLPEAVKNMINSIKSEVPKNSAKSDDQSEVAPF